MCESGALHTNGSVHEPRRCRSMPAMAPIVVLPLSGQRKPEATNWILLGRTSRIDSIRRIICGDWAL